MVAGAYARSNYSSTKPITLKYAPPHAERPYGRSNREKGKGWQRSKSSAYDYNSDAFFSEDRSNRNRRAQSSLSDRRVDTMNDSYYHNKRDRKRRMSVEAQVEANRSEISKFQPSGPTGPGKPERFKTSQNFNSGELLTQHRALTEHADANRTTPKEPMITNKEFGARPSVPLYNGPEPEAVSFPIEVSKEPSGFYEPKYRLMQMLVSTETFAGRADKYCDPDTSYRPRNGDEFELKSENVVDPKNEYINELRIELENPEKQQDPNPQVLQGRVYLNLKRNATVKSIKVYANKIIAFTSPNEAPSWVSIGGTKPNELKLLPYSEDRKQGMEDFNVRAPRKYDKVKLPSGPNEFRFNLYVPPGLPPTFTYVDPKTGKAVFTNYSAEAEVLVENRNERTGRVAIKIPAVGIKNGRYHHKEGNYDFVVFNRDFNDDDGFDFTLGYIKEENGKYEKPDDLQAFVIQKVTCDRLGLRGVPEKVAEFKKIKKDHGKDEVLEDYVDGDESRRKEWEKTWDDSYNHRNAFINVSTPSVKVGDVFKCEYFLRLKTHGKCFEGPIIRCDKFKTGDVNVPAFFTGLKEKDLKFKEVPC